MRSVAILAALTLVVSVVSLQRTASAITLSGTDARLTAGPSQALALFNLPAAPVMQIEVRPDAALAVMASTARFTPQMRKRLAELRLKLPNVKGGDIVWRASSASGSRAILRLSNGRQWSDAGLIMRHGGSGGTRELYILAAQTSLTLDIQQPGEHLEFAGADLTSATAAGPIQVEIPPGETLTLAFNGNAPPTLRLGDALNRNEPADRLPVGRLEIGTAASIPTSPRLKTVAKGLCAAPVAGLLPRTNVEPGDCRLSNKAGNDRLVASQLTIEPSRLAISATGKALLTSDGQPVNYGLWSALQNNRIVGAAFGALVLTLAWSLWRLWLGRGM